MLGVALTPRYLPAGRPRPLRITRIAVLAIGLAAGGAGLAGSLADPHLTWGTFGRAIGFESRRQSVARPGPAGCWAGAARRRPAVRAQRGPLDGVGMVQVDTAGRRISHTGWPVVALDRRQISKASRTSMIF